MSSTDGTATPRPHSTPSSSSPSVGEQDRMKTLLESMTSTLNTIQKDFQTLNKQSDELTMLGPTMAQTMEEINKLSEDIKKQEETQKKQIEGMKKTLRNKLPEQTWSKMEFISFKVTSHRDHHADAGIGFREGVRNRIREEITRKVREEVDQQIKTYIPTPLTEMVKEKDQRLKDVNIAFENSLARSKNSGMNYNDALCVVLKTDDGIKSKWYPANLTSLFAYDTGTLKNLLADYRLDEEEVPEMNFNAFLAHAGVGKQHHLEIFPS